MLYLNVSHFKQFVLFLGVCVFGGGRIWPRTCKCQWRPEAFDPLEAGATDGCELPDIVAVKHCFPVPYNRL